MKTISVVGTMKMSIPDGFTQMPSGPQDPEYSSVYMKQGESWSGLVAVFPINAADAMPFENPQAVIDGIHSALGEDQGLIEVNGGTTESGRRFIYSIVKSKNPEMGGVQYILTYHQEFSDGVIDIQGYFNEAGITGQRDSTVMEMAMRQGAINTTLTGWMQDPYDADYKNGFLMNLSEQKYLDEHFPGHPLTQLRNLTDFMIENN